MAGFATWNRYAGHPSRSAQTRHALRLKPDHPIGAGQTRVSYDGKTVDYGSAEDLLGRIKTIERQIAVASTRPIAGFAGFSRGDR